MNTLARIFGFLTLAIAGAGCSGADPAPVGSTDEPVVGGGRVTFEENAYGITFHNNAGAWVIYTACYGPKSRGGTDLTVGPGYIARLTLNQPAPDGRTTIVDDERPLVGDGTPQTAGTLSSPGHGGLGAFGWHHARGNPDFAFVGSNAWEIAGRFCAEDHGNFGVSSARVIEPPAIDANGNGTLAIDVFFTDMWTYPTPILRVRYRYLVLPNVVRMWALVTEHCANGDCGSGAPGPAFIKEPKFMSAVIGGGFTRMVMFDERNSIPTNVASTNGSCLLTNRVDPVSSTAQCDADGRARARFDFGDAASGAAGGCSTHPCLNTVMRAYGHVQGDDVVPGLASTKWENGSVGLDAWAVASEGREAASNQDSKNGGGKSQPWSCNGGSTSTDKERRWEMAAWGKPGALTAAGVGFHAWEGGTGAYDCEPLSRRFGPEGESFAVHAEYAVNGGWSLQ